MTFGHTLMFVGLLKAKNIGSYIRVLHQDLPPDSGGDGATGDAAVPGAGHLPSRPGGGQK